MAPNHAHQTKKPGKNSTATASSSGASTAPAAPAPAPAPAPTEPAAAPAPAPTPAAAAAAAAAPAAAAAGGSTPPLFAVSSSHSYVECSAFISGADVMFFIGRELGRGRFAVVHSAKLSGTMQQLAVKVPKLLHEVPNVFDPGFVGTHPAVMQHCM